VISCIAQNIFHHKVVEPFRTNVHTCQAVNQIKNSPLFHWHT